MFLDPPTVACAVDAVAPASVTAGGCGAPSFAHPRWRISDLALGIVGLLLVIAVLGVVVAVATGGGNHDLWAVIGTIGVEASMVGMVLILARRRGMGLRELGFRRPVRWGPLPIAWIGAYIMLGLYRVLLVLLTELGIDVSALDEGNPIPIGSDAEMATVALLGVAVVVAAPLGEEIFFRGLLFGGFRSYWGIFPALLLSGFLFGLFHLNISVLVPFTAVGMVFAWAMEQSKSLWPSIAAHSAFNSLAFTLHMAGI